MSFNMLPAVVVMRLLRWSFNRLYREFAWSYDLVAWVVSCGLWRRWVLCAVPYLEGRILELGPGTGYIQASLARQSATRAVALEASPQMIGLLRRRLQPIAGACCIVHGYAQHIPLASASFETVLATFPAEYILDPRTAAEIHRVLVPEGHIVLVDGAQFIPHHAAPPASPRPYLQALEAVGFGFVCHWEYVGPSRVMVLIGRLTATG